jgi:hypothetical protein
MRRLLARSIKQSFELLEFGFSASGQEGGPAAVSSNFLQSDLGRSAFAALTQTMPSALKDN